MQNIGGKADNVCPPKWSHSLQFYLGKGILLITLSHQSLLFSFLLFINHIQSTATQTQAPSRSQKHPTGPSQKANPNEQWNDERRE
jgi:hypothetical protein